MAKTVSRVSYKMVNTNHLVLFLAYWKRCVLKIKSAIRRHLKVNESRVIALTLLYNKIMTHNGVAKETKRNTLIPLGNFLGVVSVTVANKRKIVMDYLKSYLNNYVHEGIKHRRPFRLYRDREAMVSFFLLSSNGLHTTIKGKKRNTDFFSNFK